MINFIETIGFIACFCTTSSTVPQIVKMYNRNSAQDVSLATYLLSLSGVILWLVYGILLNAIPLIISNIISILLQLIVIVMILRSRYKK